MVLVEGRRESWPLEQHHGVHVQRDVVGEMLLAHELTHALQDQNFDLESSLDKVKDDDDRSLALKSVTEGDATMRRVRLRGQGAGRHHRSIPSPTICKQLPQALEAEAPGTPEGLSVPLLFQYSEGVRFVAEAYRRGGWSAVDALYRKPPQSSHQILHPALYFDGSAPVPRIDLAGYEEL